MPLLRVEGLNKRFGERWLLTESALTLYPGARYVLTGDNGAGKTTLLKILAGLESAEAERFEYGGTVFDLAHYPAALRQEIVYVHQHPYLFNTTVAGNIGYGLRVRRMPRRDREKRIREAMAWAGVAQLSDVPPHKLSGGEKHRVAIARARVLEPRLLLLDEPTANLDADARRQIIHLLQDLASSKTCVLMASHDPEIIYLPHATTFRLEQGRIGAVNGSPRIDYVP